MNVYELNEAVALLTAKHKNGEMTDREFIDTILKLTEQTTLPADFEDDDFEDDRIN